MNFTVSLETHVTFRDEDKNIIAIEDQNGHITRYLCRTMGTGDSWKLFGVDKPLKEIKK